MRIDPETGALLTGGTSIRPRADLAAKLAKHLRAPKIAYESLENTKSKLSSIEERRNRAVHGHRLLDVNDPNRENVEMLRGGFKGRHPQTNDDLNKLALDIQKVAADLHDSLSISGLLDAPYNKPQHIK